MEEASQGGTSLIPKTPQPELSAGASELRRMLEVVENEILPKTAVQVAAGNKFFGAAVLDSDFNTVVADTNRETECPLYHGEIYTIQQWAAVTEKPPVQGKAAIHFQVSCSDTQVRVRTLFSASIFLSTHEPCCMCISAIVWSGFRRCFYLYPYETTRDEHGIPHDLDIMYELWRVRRYSRRNSFCATAGLLELVQALPRGDRGQAAERAELLATVARITRKYEELAPKYHSQKSSNPKNTMAFN